MSTEVGSGQVSIFPIFKGFRKAVVAEVDGASATAGNRFTKNLNSAAKSTGSSSGKAFSTSFTSASSGLAQASLKQLENDVATASRNVSTSRLKEQDAIGKVRVATVQLTEATAKYGDTNSRTVAAAERLASSQRNLGLVQDTLKTRTVSLVTSQLALAKGQQAIVDGVGRSTNGFRNFFSTIGNSGGFQSAIAGAERLSMSVGNTVVNGLATAGRAFLSFARTGVTAIAAVGAALAGATIVGGISRLVQVETAQAKLKALGNTAADVATIMTNANDAVIGTQYALGDAVTVAASAVAAGIKPGQDLAKYLRLVANTAAITGDSLEDTGSALNNVQAQQAAYNDSLQIFAQKGLPIYALLSKQLHLSVADVKELASEGKISAAQFNEALSSGIGDAAVEIGKTTVGSFENVIAASKRLGQQLAGPSYAQFSTFFLGIQGFLNDLTAKWAPKAGVALGKVTEKALGFATTFLDTVGKIADSDKGFTLENIRTQFEKAFPKSSGAFAVLDSLKDVLPTLATSLKKIAPSLVKVLPPLAELASEVLPLIAQILPTITPLITSALGSVTNFVGTINGLLDPDIWRKFFDPTVSDDQLATKLQGSNSTILQGMGNIAATLDSFTTDQDRQFNEFFAGVGDNFGYFGQQIGSFFVDLDTNVTAGETAFFNAIGGFFTGLGPAFANGANQIGGFFSTIGTAFSTGVSVVVTNALNAGGSIINAFAKGIRDATKNVTSAISKIMEIIGDFFPHSPAKRGPLSGAGWTAIGNSGTAIMDQFNSGFSSPNTSGLAQSLAPIAGTSSTASSAGGGNVYIDKIVAPDQDPVVSGRIMGREFVRQMAG